MRILLRLVLLLGLLVVLAAGAIFYALSNVAGPRQLSAALQRSVEAATGRRLRVDGPVRLTLGLVPHLEAQQVALANPSGAPHADMLTVGRLDATLALAPLLNGEVVIEQLTLHDADLRLETGADGVPNWQFPAAKRALYGGDSGAGSGIGDLHHVVVEGGRITYVPAPGGIVPLPTLTATVDRLDWSADSDSSLMRVKAEGQTAAGPFTAKILAGSLERLEGGPVAPLAGSWPLTVDATASGALLHLDGGFTHPDQGRAYDFRLTVNIPQLEQMQPFVPGVKLPPLREVNFTTRLTDGNTGVMRTEGLSLHAGAADLGSVVPGLVLKEAVLSAPGPGQTAQLSVNGTYQGQSLSAAGTATQPDVVASATAPVPVAIGAQIGDASLSARGNLPPGLGLSGLDLTVSARVPDLSALSGLAGRSLPPAHDVNLSARLGDAGFRLRGVALRDLKFTSSIGDLSGNVTAAWAPVLDLSGTLSSDHFDLDALGISAHRLEPVPTAPPPPPVAALPGVAPPAPMLIPDTPLPFGLLKGADADLTVTVAELVAGGDHYRDLEAGLRSAEGRLTLNPFRITAPQGVVIGGITVDASGDVPTVAANLRSPALAAGAIAAALGAPGEVGGTMQVDAQLVGSGSSPRALAASLDGHVGIAMVNGRISNALIEQWLGSTLSAAGVPPLPDGDAVVSCLAARADLHQGQGRLRVLAIDSTQVTMDGSGNFDLGAETLDLHLRPQVIAGGTTVAAPVSLTGSFADPKAALDPVMGNGRVGLTIGGRPASRCVGALAVARGGLPGPMPTPMGVAATPGSGKKPVDLLQGLFH